MKSSFPGEVSVSMSFGHVDSVTDWRWIKDKHRMGGKKRLKSCLSLYYVNECAMNRNVEIGDETQGKARVVSSDACRNLTKSRQNESWLGERSEERQLLFNGGHQMGVRVTRKKI